MAETIQTPLTKLFGIKYPIILAGMNKASGPKLAAAVTNAGGLGVIGGYNMSPRILRLTIKHLKDDLKDKSAPFGVDLLIPKVGGGARPTNKDYTGGKLMELIDIIIESGAKLFVCAVGVAPREVVKKLHDAGILYMNMIGSPKHVKYALGAGADIICCQGGEGGGHTGEVASTCLLPKVVDMIKGKRSELNPNQPIYAVGAGGIYDGRGLAMALNYGAEAIWVGTRFVCSTESGASNAHKQAIIDASNHDTIRTEIFSGRPLRVVKNDYILNWERNRKDEMRKLLKNGILPFQYDKENNAKTTPDFDRHLTGQCCGNIHDIKSAKQIIEDMVNECIAMMRYNTSRITLTSKL
mmetsp:Transcript_63598/g.57270  ORF Transcript_63598/g.57270 Transcript_63598/m.57270 type:complete len:353 (+) Transcript_63598:15-1073(+)